jgi:hypothetical protein
VSEVVVVDVKKQTKKLSDLSVHFPWGFCPPAMINQQWASIRFASRLKPSLIEFQLRD